VNLTPLSRLLTNRLSGVRVSGIFTAGIIGVINNDLPVNNVQVLITAGIFVRVPFYFPLFNLLKFVGN
jgi:hypothetical protein